ncbi:zinc finger protein-domain-containing protein [Xylariomycetidae sp. FL2044]|nr:zinc finger protein-domain-containing protein [Xylariomycetidae sp. FL2044]
MNYDIGDVSPTSGYSKIGAGACGTIYSPIPGRPEISSPPAIPPPIILKRGDGDSARSVRNDYGMHQAVLQASKTYASQLKHHNVLVPDCHALVESGSMSGGGNNAHADHLGSLFAEKYDILVAERIPSLSDHTQHALIDRYCPAGKRAQIREGVRMDQNQNCLVRPYLGRRKSQPSAFFRLRNFGLCADQMEELGADMDGYARALACSLALMHWGAGIDADDIEFVLAPARNDPAEAPPSLGFRSGEVLGDHCCLWILDFDRCRRMTMDEAGVEQAARAFLRNDPYYPRPGRDNANDQRLWRLFAGAFIAESNEMMLRSGADKFRVMSGLPEKLIAKIEELQGSKSRMI